ncbi:ABATE domain-containing protein [Saccharothrix sp. NPDC042600]|uniref:CGNR zinc finger domain-containing protein n=1 Tax=Saccharothrix TaxID=2071 RepID=UPI003409404F|nr:CGNR zinc finger domain-containing protein [Saccharothrix mutabilis subsp. capreolus]
MNRALEFAATVRHDGHGGLDDTLSSVEALEAWSGVPATEGLLHAVIELRWAVRSLFAHAAEAGTRIDTPHLRPLDEALRTVNAAAAAAPRAARLEWGTPPTLHHVDTATPGDRLLADLATAAIELLASAERDDLRACPSPRCIRYFVRTHPKQQWCKPSCGNRARVSRHYHRTRD